MSVVDDLLASPRGLVALTVIANARMASPDIADSSATTSDLVTPRPTSKSTSDGKLTDFRVRDDSFEDPLRESALADLVCGEVDPWRWRPDRRSIQARLMSRAGLLRPLAEQLVTSPEAAWWFDGFDPQRQIWISKRVDVAPDRALFVASLKSHPGATRPRKAFATSAALSFLPCAWLLYAWEGIYRPPFGIWRMPLRKGVRVFEIHGPNDWIDLCRRYPADTSHVHEQLLHEFEVKDRPFISPDWTAVARDFDGVYLSMIGRLTAEGVPLRLDPGICMLEAWDYAGTEWLTWKFEGTEYLGSYEGERRLRK